MTWRVSKPVVAALIGLTILGACSSSFIDRRARFDGQLYRGNAQPIDKSDRRDFVASAGPISRGANGARQALAYEGTKYCIRWFGVSTIAWNVDPADPEASLPADRDRYTARGRCIE